MKVTVIKQNPGESEEDFMKRIEADMKRRTRGCKKISAKKLDGNKTTEESIADAFSEALADQI